MISFYSFSEGNFSITDMPNPLMRSQILQFIYVEHYIAQLHSETLAALLYFLCATHCIAQPNTLFQICRKLYCVAEHCIAHTSKEIILVLFCLHRRYMFDNRLTGEA